MCGRPTVRPLALIYILTVRTITADATAGFGAVLPSSGQFDAVAASQRVGDAAGMAAARRYGESVTNALIGPSKPTRGGHPAIAAWPPDGVVLPAGARNVDVVLVMDAVGDWALQYSFAAIAGKWCLWRKACALSFRASAETVHLRLT